MGFLIAYFFSHQITQEVYNILEPRGYNMKCRGKINVKGKGSMITYFLQRKSTTDDDMLTHQSSKVTAVSSEDYEVYELDDQINFDAACLNQKRKSLCRQHNIFSSITSKSGKSVTSEHSMGDSIDFDDDTTIVDEKTKLIDEPAHTNAMQVLNTVISPEIYPKNLFKPNIPAHCTALKDSIESLEKLLKNDFSLSDINATKVVIAPSSNTNVENGEAANLTNDTKVAPLADHVMSQSSIMTTLNGTIPSTIPNDTSKTTTSIMAKGDGKIRTAFTSMLTQSATNEDCQKNTHNKIANFSDKGSMKLSKSWYPLNRDQLNHKVKLPNSKSLHLISTQNQNGPIFL